MSNQKSALSGWALSFSGEAGNPGSDKIMVIRQAHPQIHLEIDAPEIRSAAISDKPLVRRTIQEALTALQEALDSPSALPGLRPD